VSLRAKFLLALLIMPVPLHADDGAASIAAGGIVVMKREARITMAKEVLQISSSKVIVDYDFRNDSDDDITTEVAFPIPDYNFDLNRVGDQQGFDDFQLWIDGASAHYLVEARAFVKGRDYTQLLNGMHVDIASYGHGPPLDKGGRATAKSRDIQALTVAQRKQLERIGVIAQDCDGDDKNCIDEPLWTVRKKYHWQQTFSAHKIVHIRHEYSPVGGSSNSVAYGMQANPDAGSAAEIKSFCLDGPLRTSLQQIADGKDKGKTASYSYVDFILTTANTWKMPIEDFTLIVERTHWKNNQGERDLGNYVSFCWDGPIIKTDADHFTAHTLRLVPSKEVRIGFFGIERRK